jgi:hypothetical protein
MQRQFDAMMALRAARGYRPTQGPERFRGVITGLPNLFLAAVSMPEDADGYVPVTEDEPDNPDEWRDYGDE